jgi:hypothetical protein
MGWQRRSWHIATLTRLLGFVSFHSTEKYKIKGMEADGGMRLEWLFGQSV